MSKIDVSYRYAPKVLKGGKMLMDTDTGIETLVGPEDTTAYPTSYTLNMTMDMEDKAEAEAALKNNPEPEKVPEMAVDKMVKPKGGKHGA